MQLSAGTTPKKAILLAISLLAAVYLAINLGLPKLHLNSNISTYVVQPCLWLGIAALAWFLPRYRTAAKLRDRPSIIQMAVILGVFQVAMCVIGGFFSGFGKSPYNLGPTGIMSNLFYAGAMLVGMELGRAWLVNHLARRHVFLALAFVSVIFTALSIPLAQITGIKPEVGSISFINSTLLPTLAENLLATFLALLAGPVPALLYRGVIQAFWWLSPVLPDLPWALKGLIGTALPIIGLVVVNSMFSPLSEKRHRHVNEGSLAGWVVTTIASVALVWFSVGLSPSCRRW